MPVDHQRLDPPSADNTTLHHQSPSSRRNAHQLPTQCVHDTLTGEDGSRREVGRQGRGKSAKLAATASTTDSRGLPHYESESASMEVGMDRFDRHALTTRAGPLKA